MSEIALIVEKATDKESVLTGYVYIGSANINVTTNTNVPTNTYVKVISKEKSHPFCCVIDDKLPAGRIRLNQFQREFLQVSEGDRVNVSMEKIVLGPISQVRFSVKPCYNSPFEVKESELRNLVSQKLSHVIWDIYLKQPLFIPRCNRTVILEAINITRNNGLDKSNQSSQTSLAYSFEAVDAGSLIIIEDDDLHSEQIYQQQKKVFNAKELGIGGLSEQIQDIFRRTFASRFASVEKMKRLNLKHTKGLLLYGPPGTGKTLIARKIGESLNCHKPKILVGSEILNKYVGEAENRLRLLFEPARKEYEQKKDKSGIHLIIIDEIDAICRSRSGSEVRAGDSIVNQLLGIMDGVEQMDNFILIGLTNRRDLIDPALLRPGRFEVQIEVPLPDFQGRKEIFEIYLDHYRKNGVLDQDINLDELARETEHFSGAEIEGLIRSCVSRLIDQADDAKISQKDLLLAITEQMLFK